MIARLVLFIGVAFFLFCARFQNVVGVESSRLNYEAQIIPGQNIEDLCCHVCLGFVEPSQSSACPSCDNLFCVPYVCSVNLLSAHTSCTSVLN